ncbi:MAG: ribonuclease III [Actinomycetota bacterium]|nr:ribonuclease III [Actinomycetota bacterium]
MTELLQPLADRIGYSFKDSGLMQLAMSHRSWCAERHDSPSNERLELLGDAVLGHCVTAHLYRIHPEWSEGELAQARSAVVNSSSLARVAQEYDIGSALLLGVGEERSGGRGKASLLCDAFEALLGAIYLDAGLETVERFILEALRLRIEEVAIDPGVDDAKTRLQELVVRAHGDSPTYVLTDSGPDHDKCFSAEVWFAGSIQGKGEGTSKKQAEQAAASQAWQAIGAIDEPDRPTTQGRSEHARTP